MISYLSFLLATIAPMNTGSIASSSASYDGSTLLLDGEDSIEHGLGKMEAEKAVLTKQVAGQAEFPFTHIELADAVRLALSTTAHVVCERASLDFSNLKGVLTSPKNVHYVDKIHATPFELFSPYLDLQKAKSVQQKENYTIENAYARNGVHLI